MELGFLRVASAVPFTAVACCEGNRQAILEQIDEAVAKKVELLVFPELCVTSYTCADLFLQETLLRNAEQSILEIASYTKNKPLLCFIGAPIRYMSRLYNCAIAISNGEVKCIIPKSYIPNSNEFYEKRWFASALDISPMAEIELTKEGCRVPFGTDIIIDYNNAHIAAEICEDLWAPVPPSSIAAINGANVIVNLSASNEVISKHNYLLSLIKQQSARCYSAYVYSSAGYGESTTDLVFPGKAIIAENGTLKCENERFTRKPQLEIADIDIDKLESLRRNSTSFRDSYHEYKRNYRHIYVSNTLKDAKLDTCYFTTNPYPFVPQNDSALKSRCKEILDIQVEGLVKRLECTRTSNLVVGISGGLDSTLALLVAYRAFKSLNLPLTGLVGITMPGFGTTNRTYNNAISLMRELGITIKEISIKDAVIQHFKDIEHDINNHDVTYENSQARERTQILMDYANKVGGMVLGTGDLSELALGWATYNGDHMSMYAVNSSVPKTLVKYLVKWVSETIENETVRETLTDILNTPVSPELLPSNENGEIQQITEDLVGPYELHDFFLYNMLRYGFSPQKIFRLATLAFPKYSASIVHKWLKVFYRRFFTQQFKRSCMPDGPKVGSITLSPRGDWRMPSDATVSMWLNECDEIDL